MVRMLGLWVVLLLAISSIMWASNSDYKAAQYEHKHACEMVRIGAWPPELCRK